MTIGARIRARVLRVLLAVCIFIPFFAYAAGTDVTDARAVWVALSGSVLKVSPTDGSVSLTLPGTPAPQGFAVDQDDESVWIYSKKSLESFDLQGNPLLSASLPNNFHGGTPDGMAVDNSAGNIWIAIQKDLYQIDMAGVVKNDIRLSANAVGIALDPTRSHLWVAEQSGIEVFDATGTSQLSVSLSGAPVAIAYDKTLDQVWVSSSGQIARYSSSGALALSAPLASGLGSLIAVDGQGGLWTASGQNLAYLNSAGQTQFEVQPFAGEDGGDAVDLVADVLNQSAWVANARHLRQYGSNGSFIKEAALSLPSGNGQAVQRLGIYVDTIPPTVSITAPQSGAYTNHNKPTLVLSYSDIGSGVDPTTVAVISNGVGLPVTCVANSDGSGASCTPNAVLPDGGYSLSITVQDKAGNTSQPATVSFTVDTVPPTITVTSPASPYTNQPSFTVAGSISEAGTLTLNGQSVSLSATSSFSTVLGLVQGDNTLTFVATDLAGNVTTITKTLNLNTIPPIPVVNADISVAGPANGQVTVSGKAGAVAPNVSVTITDTKIGQSVTVTSDATGAFTATLAAGNNDSLQIVETDQWGNVTTDPNTIAVSNLPPDPASVAPPLSSTGFTTFGDQMSFLYSGANPIQTGVAPGAIDPTQVSVIRGKVMDAAGNALPGVTISVLNHPEFGQTLSRADGMFDIAVNGGGYVTLDYSLKGYLPAQRQVQLRWNVYTTVDTDVALIKPDPKVTPVSFGASSDQIVQGSVVTDARGTRQATVYFPAGTTATMVMSDGSTQPLTSGSFRATEFTAGPMGANTMPAGLPNGTNYTYAVDLSFDEAGAAGATGVTFSQPVPVYLNNFLGVPAGYAVPNFYLDQAQGQWIPSGSGDVIGVLGIDSQGNAILNVDGGGKAATAAELTQLGITTTELGQIAHQFAVGASFWRFTVSHFTTYDFNFLHPSSQTTNNPSTKPQQPPCPDHNKGCDISAEYQSLGENVPVTGTPYVLHYDSDRQPGDKSADVVHVQVTAPTVPSNLSLVIVRVDIEGKSYTRQISSPPPNDVETFYWDGFDVFGRAVHGQVPAVIHVGYVYSPVISRILPKFSSCCVVSAAFGSSDTSNVLVETDWSMTFTEVGNASTPPQGGASGADGWSLSVHHAMDPATGTVYFGDGRTRLGVNAATVVRRTPTLCCSTFATPLPANIEPGSNAIAMAANGDIYFSGIVNGSGIGSLSGIFKLDHSSHVITQLLSLNNSPSTIARGNDGTIYYSQEVPNSFNVQVFRFMPGQTPTVVNGLNVDVGLAGLAVGPDGTLYASDDWQAALWSVTKDGTVAKAWQFGSDNEMGDVVVGPDGKVYFGGETTGHIYTLPVQSNGQPVVVVGKGGGQNFSGDGGPATGATFVYIYSFAVGPDNVLYINDAGRIRRVGTDGIIKTIAGTGRNIANPVTPALGSYVGTGHMAVAPDGTLKLVDSFHNAIWSIEPALPGASTLLGSSVLSGYQVVSDDGRELYLFDSSGRHFETVDTVTKAVLYSFGYNANGNLISITDANGRITTISRDASGNATAIASPDGQVTKLTVDGNGYLNSITDPAGDAWKMTYGVGGLLSTFQDPNKNLDSYSYDNVGQFIKNTNAVSGGLILTRSESQGNYTVTSTSAGGLKHSYTTLNNPDGTQSLLVAAPDGTVDQSLMSQTGNSEADTAADGTVTTTQFGPDPRLGTDVKLPVSLTIKTPSGLTLASSESVSAPLTNGSDVFSFTSLTNTTTVNGQNYVSTYAPSTKTWTSTTPVGRKTTTVVDGLGRPVSIQLGNLAPVTYSYDALGHIQNVAAGSGTTARPTQYSYYTSGPSQGYLQSTTDALNRTVGYQYDDAGRISLETLPDGQQIQFGYDANGNLTSLTPPSRPAHSFDYDGIDEMQDYTPPAVTGVTNSATHYTYNLDRQLTEVTRPDGQQINLGYDTGGRLSIVTLPTGSYTYAYTPKGQVQSITAPSTEALSYTWDGLLNTGEAWSGPVTGSITRTFDNNFHVIGIGVNGSSVSYAYDNDGLITAAGAEILKRDTTDGLITGTTLGTIVTAETYDSFGEPLTDATNGGTAALYSVSYTRDNLGRITGKAETINGASHNYAYGYDQQGRLDAVTQDGVQISYGYDANGNRIAVNGATIATYDDQDRLLAYGANSYSYTANGELQTKTDGSGTTNYTFDVLGNLLEAKLPNGTDIRYLIDGKKRRIGKEINGNLVQGFLYQNQLSPVAELDGSGNVLQRYVYGTHANVPDYIIQGSNTYRVITDQTGSPRLIVDTTTGNVAEEIDYDAWGNVVNDTNPGFQPFGFAGGLYDPDTKLVRFGARDYDPQTGRWGQKDPLLFTGGDTNLYGYVLNDPINCVDPLGLWRFGDNLPDWLVNTSAGFGDGITFGLTNYIRNQWDINSVVDKCTLTYQGAYFAGEVTDSYLGGAAAGATASYIANNARSAATVGSLVLSLNAADPAATLSEVTFEPVSDVVEQIQNFDEIANSSTLQSEGNALNPTEIPTPPSHNP